MDALAKFIDAVVAHHDELLGSHQYERELRRNDWLQPNATGFIEDQSPRREDGRTGEVIPKPRLVVQVLGDTTWRQAYAAAIRERPDIAEPINRLFRACKRLRDAVGEAANDGRMLNYDGDAAALAEFGDAWEELRPFVVPAPEPKRTADGEPAKERLRIEHRDGEFYGIFDEVPFTLSANGHTYLEALIKARGRKLVSGPAIGITHVKRAREKFPKALLEVIEVSDGGGSRLTIYDE